MAYKVSITAAAAADLDNLLLYMIEMLHNKPAASRFYETFQTKLALLASHPLICELARDSVLRSKGYRKLVIDNYIILYTVDTKNKIVTIMRIFYGRQKYKDSV